MDAPRRSMERLVRLAAWNGRTSPAHTKDWKQVCPVCGSEVKTQGPHYWEARRNGENVSPVTRVYCSNKCRQKAYRTRRAPERNAPKSRLPNNGHSRAGNAQKRPSAKIMLASRALLGVMGVIVITDALDAKAKSRSVSLPETLWDAVHSYVPTVHHDRSSWIKMLVTKALAEANALPADPAARELIRLRELIALHGVEVVAVKLNELAESAELAAGGGR